MNDKLLIIIPCYNEEKHIASVIAGIRKVFITGADILVVNDHSTDSTGEIAQMSGAGMVDLFARVPYGAVIQTGFKYAMLKGYDYIASIDGDEQHDPLYLRQMYEIVSQEKADLVIGSRFIEKTGYKMPFLRKVGSRIFSAIVALLSGKKIYDPTSGYQLFNRKVLEYYCDDDYPVDYPDADVLLKLIYRGITVEEIAVRMRPNPEKSMHSGLSVIYYVMKMFLSIFIVFLINRDLKKGEK